MSRRDKFDAGPFHSKTSVLDHYMAISQPRHSMFIQSYLPALACASGLLPPLFHPPAGQVRLFPGCLVLRSTRNLIKRVQIPQEHIILLLGSAPDSSPAEARSLASKPTGAGKQFLPWCPWVKEEQLPAFLLGQSFTEFKNMMGMIYILGF